MKRQIKNREGKKKITWGGGDRQCTKAMLTRIHKMMKETRKRGGREKRVKTLFFRRNLVLWIRARLRARSPYSIKDVNLTTSV